MTTLDSFDEGEDAPPTAVIAAQSFAPRMWGSLCYDLIFSNKDYKPVCASYGITEETLALLLDNPHFAAQYRACKAQVKELGPNAAFVLTAKAEASAHIVTLSNIASQTLTPPAVRVKAIETIIRCAGLDPSTQKEDKNASASAVVQFVIGGGLLGAATHTIDVSPSAQERLA